MNRRRTNKAKHEGARNPDVILGGALLAAAAVITAVAPPRPRRSRRGPHPAAIGRRVPSTTKSGLVGRVDMFQQGRRWIGVPVAVVRKYGDDRTGRHVTILAYYGFFSLFPALLALVTILGFVLQGHPALREQVAGSALANFPIVGATIASSVGRGLSGNTFALVIGLAGAVWAGMGMAQAAQNAMNDVWAVARVEQPGFLAKRARSMLALTMIAAFTLASTAVAQLVVLVSAGIAASAGFVVASLLLNTVVFMVAFRVLTVKSLSWRTVLPGALFSAAVYTTLQLLGGLFVSRTISGASETYGTFAVVIGLLSWIFFISQVTMLGAQINVVLHHHLWPRSLFTEPATEDGPEGAP